MTAEHVGWACAAALLVMRPVAEMERTRSVSDPQDAGSRFAERLLETLLGVGLAYLFGLALPPLAGRRRPRGPKSPAQIRP